MTSVRVSEIFLVQCDLFCVQLALCFVVGASAEFHMADGKAEKNPRRAKKRWIPVAKSCLAVSSPLCSSTSENP